MFYDIFEKTKRVKKAEKRIKPLIIADIHEKNSLILAELKSCNEIEIKTTALKIGDYQIGEVIIERKTTTDFISSMITKRLIKQIIQMKQYEKRIIIIEGDRKDLYNKINPNAVRGFILSIILNHKINIIFTTDYKDTVAYLVTLAKKGLKQISEPTLHSRIPKTPSEQKKYILESFPGIGPKKAELLLKKFSSLEKVFSAEENEINKILGTNSNKFIEILKGRLT